MAFQRQNYFQRRTKPRGPRTNDRIRALEVQVISSDGKNLGTFAIKEAIEMAKQEELDLVGTADPGLFKNEYEKNLYKNKFDLFGFFMTLDHCENALGLSLIHI